MRLQLLLISAFLLTPCSYAEEKVMDGSKLEKATFAGGCFWCMQPFLERLKGVKKVTVGYTGGKTANPTYDQISTGETGHAEAVEVEFDPNLVSYEKVINLFWRNIDPTAVNAQFVDHGSQYRTAIFYHSEAQRRIAEETKKQIAASGRFDKPIATEIVPATTFYPAEEYHQGYYKKSPVHYEMYHHGSGREQFLDHVWGQNGH
jgi:methionine-S-sulfoxide reductase